MSPHVDSARHCHCSSGFTGIDPQPLLSQSPLPLAGALPLAPNLLQRHNIRGLLADRRRHITGSRLGTSHPNNSLLCTSERSVQMVFKMGVRHFTNHWVFYPIRMGNRRTVSDHTAVPADGHTMGKFHSHAAEWSSVWFLSVYIW